VLRVYPGGKLNPGWQYTGGFRRGRGMTSSDRDAGGAPRAAVMLLGTFHFQDAGLDAYKPRFSIDILSEPRQGEVAEVVELLAAFQPTRIAVERRPERQDETDRDFAAYRRGESALSANEIHQIGFRLAQRLGHDRVYCVDAWGRYYAPPLDLEVYGQGMTTKALGELLESQFSFDPHGDLEVYAREHGQEPLLLEWWDQLKWVGEQGDERKICQTLRESLVEANTEANILRSHGSYLSGWFRVGIGSEYPGVDYVTAWYNRNLRIFANLQRITGSPEDRILLIIGGGHLPILRHCVQASQDHDLVEVAQYLGGGR
jgi:hypothetical protein